MAEMLESPLEHVFGDSFISLPRDVFSTVNADYAYEAGKLGCYLMETLQYHTKMHASIFGLRHIVNGMLMYPFHSVRVATVQYRRFSSLLPHQESSMR